MIRRLWFKRTNTQLDSDREMTFDVEQVPAPDLISSVVCPHDGEHTQEAFSSHRHVVVLDIDFLTWVRPSETPGHYHLFIDKTMTWDVYLELLEALAKAGIIQHGYLNAAKARGATFVAMVPWKGAER